MMKVRYNVAFVSEIRGVKVFLKNRLFMYYSYFILIIGTLRASHLLKKKMVQLVRDNLSCLFFVYLSLLPFFHGNCFFLQKNVSLKAIYTTILVQSIYLIQLH